MAYQVLARKLRPKIFDAIVGQEHVTTTLLNSLKNDRVPHALLFTGARGVGKTTAARVFAKSLRCTHAVNFVPCGVCSDCVEISEGRAIDVVEIDGASNNGVENVRELRESVGYMPSRGKYKVYIIDEVHMLSNSAFNALLKTLEEPPAHVVFVFATTEVQKIPVTILSRVQRYDFRRIPVKKIADYLAQVLKDENVEVESQALWLVAREAEGSMRDSLSLLDQVISFCGNKITLTQVVEILGLTDRTLLSNTLKALVARDAQGCLDIAEKVFKLGYDPKQFAQDLLEHIRNLMIVKMSGNTRSDFLDLPEQEITELMGVGESLSNEDIHLLFDMTLKGVTDVMRAQDPRVVLEMLLLRMSQAPRLESIESLISGARTSGIGHISPATAVVKKNSIELKSPNDEENYSKANEDSEPPESASMSSVPVSLAAQFAAVKAANIVQTAADTAATVKAAEAAQIKIQNTPPQPSQNPASDFSTIRLLEVIKKEKPLLGAKLEYASFEFAGDFPGSGDTSNNLGIFFRKEQEFFYNQVSQGDVVKQLMDLIGKHWGKTINIEVKLGDKKNQGPLSPQETTASKNKSDAEILRQKIENHPMVKEAKDILKAKVTSIGESS